MLQEELDKKDKEVKEARKLLKVELKSFFQKDSSPTDLVTINFNRGRIDDNTVEDVLKWVFPRYGQEIYGKKWKSLMPNFYYSIETRAHTHIHLVINELNEEQFKLLNQLFQMAELVIFNNISIKTKNVNTQLLHLIDVYESNNYFGVNYDKAMTSLSLRDREVYLADRLNYRPFYYQNEHFITNKLKRTRVKLHSHRSEILNILSMKVFSNQDLKRISAELSEFREQEDEYYKALSLYNKKLRDEHTGEKKTFEQAYMDNDCVDKSNFFKPAKLSIIDGLIHQRQKELLQKREKVMGMSDMWQGLYGVARKMDVYEIYKKILSKPICVLEDAEILEWLNDMKYLIESNENDNSSDDVFYYAVKDTNGLNHNFGTKDMLFRY